MTNDLKPFRGSRGAWAALGLLLVLGACGLDEVAIPDLEGPAELGLSLKLTASPDIITADGFSTSLIQATLRDQNGNPVAGRAIFMTVADADGRLADIGQLRSTSGSGLGTGIVVNTGSNGVAQAAYEAPARTDFTSHGSILVGARPVGDDANGQIYRTVRVELRSAEPRLFPQVPGNALPLCGFVIEAVSGACGVPVPVPTPSTSPAPSAPPATPSPATPVTCSVRVNTTVLFQTTARDTDGTIVRYEWFFGDGTREDKPDTAKVYRSTGTFNITHLVTDNSGGQAACAASLNVVP